MVLKIKWKTKTESLSLGVVTCLEKDSSHFTKNFVKNKNKNCWPNKFVVEFEFENQ